MIRKATITDLEAITEIYNDAIINTVATFDTQPKTLKEQKEWFRSHDSKHPILVVEEGPNILGWASLSKWSDRYAYSLAAEISIYIKKEYRGKGFGKRLSEAILQEGRKVGLHTVIARIAEGNEISVHLFESFGFKHIGILKEVGRKFGKLLDVHLMQKIFKDDHTL
ncbi:N-acetyltransferase [candidate division WOR-3 bacterium]|nr:N-acetyltransferase [candidate division WOR-3 bacterium]